MKRALVVLVLVVLSGCSKTTAPAPAPQPTTQPTSVAPTIKPPSVAPKTSSSFPPMDIDPAFLGAMRQSGPTGNPDYAIWRQVPDSVLTDLGHNVTSLFASYDGTVACVNVNSLDWGKDASTDNCEEALFQTVTFLDKTGTTSGMNTSHEGNLFLIGAATAAYLQ